jgi:hypothetical protein
MRNADRIRIHAREKYAAVARSRKETHFSIKVSDVVKELKLSGRVPSVCSALRSREFLRENGLRVANTSGPPSRQSTTVVYTYEFSNAERARDKEGGGAGNGPSRQDAWNRLRGALQDVFAEYGGGEAYLRNERTFFRDADERK